MLSDNDAVWPLL